MASFPFHPYLFERQGCRRREAGLTIFFTSDTHFGHGGALGLYRRPFHTVADMDAGLIEQWNAAVGATDEIWHLGDFAIRQKATRVDELLERLNGTKHLVVGNNDRPEVTSASGWASVQPYAELALDDRLVILCHYAFRTWRRMDQGAINLHGHSHGRLTLLPRQWDVGVDVWNFRPVTLDTICLAGRTRPTPRSVRQ
jgi:calcineurin-like phosphoesterase family protein